MWSLRSGFSPKVLLLACLAWVCFDVCGMSAKAKQGKGGGCTVQNSHEVEIPHHHVRRVLSAGAVVGDCVRHLSTPPLQLLLTSFLAQIELPGVRHHLLCRPDEDPISDLVAIIPIRRLTKLSVGVNLI